MTKRFESQAATRAVMTVGDGGRGFVVELDTRRVIVTAAHCLPHLPPAHPWADLYEKTYAKILGPLGATPRTLWAECLFVDPVADLAVLTEPDSQELSEECEAFRDAMDACTPIRLSHRDLNGWASAWLLSLDGHWRECRVQVSGTHEKTLTLADAKIVNGMSGSPIVLGDDGTALGLISTGSREPRLSACLPVWMVQRLGRTTRGRGTR